jgi:hypothetical protein
MWLNLDLSRLCKFWILPVKHISLGRRRIPLDTLIGDKYTQPTMFFPDVTLPISVDIPLADIAAVCCHLTYLYRIPL